MPASNDTAGVIAPPPLIALGVVIAGLVLDRVLPAYVLVVLLSLTARIVIGVILLGAGCALGVAAVNAFRSAATPVEPWKPTATLVTGGIFEWLRNPMYVGGALILAGLAILLASDWTLVLTVLFAVVIHYGVVMREERYLAGKFGDPYRQYLRKVPRYGLPG